MRGRSLLWAGPGVLRIGARTAGEDEPLAALSVDPGDGAGEVAGEGVGEEPWGERPAAAGGAATSAVPPGAPEPPAAYALSNVTKSKG